MAKKPILIFSLITFSLFSLSSPLSSDAVLNAAEVLSNSGYLSMALTLELVSSTLTSQPPSATIFCPSDAAFIDSGQPPLSLLQLHFSPLAFSFESLHSLPYGTKIPTLSPGKSLISTTTSFSDEHVSLNNVTITGSPIYDDGSLIVFGIDRFFDLDFDLDLPNPNPSSNLRCVDPKTAPISSSEASRILRSRGYSVMASFLDLQLLGFGEQRDLTVFAPVDSVVLELIGNFSEYSLFLRHVVPCKLTWTDLSNLEDGTVLRTFSEHFGIKITKSNGLLLLNGVPLTFPDMYTSDWLVVHGVHEVLQMMPESPEEDAQSPSELEGEEWIAPDRSEF